MADNSDVKKELEKAIEDGVKLFKVYKRMSNKFQEDQKILMNSPELKRELANLKKNYEEKVKIAKADKNATSTTTTLKSLKNTYDKQLNLIQKKSELSEIYLVNYDKKFLKEKEHIRKLKKIILSKIKEAFSELKARMRDVDFNKLEKDIRESQYQISKNKAITFKTLMNHLNSGQVSENVAKTTKQIDELMTIGNIVNRKKQMEIGIKQKEIQKLMENYEKTNKLSKESVKKEITKLVKSLNGISNANEKEAVTTKIDRLSRSLQNEMTERQRKIKYDIQTKIKQLQKLEKSS
jgi:hypothetical protein